MLFRVNLVCKSGLLVRQTTQPKAAQFRGRQIDSDQEIFSFCTKEISIKSVAQVSA